jgi:hypothetical protein
MTAPVEDTIVQILDEKGAWIDYARTTRDDALAAVVAGHLPNNNRPEPMRAVDWITKEEIEPDHDRRKQKAIRDADYEAKLREEAKLTRTAPSSEEDTAMVAKTETAAPATITAPEAAKKIGVEPKVFRRFLRSDASPISAVGQGARYAIDPKQLPTLKKEFAKWSKEQAEAKAKHEAAKAEKASGSEDPTEDSESEADDDEPKPEREADVVDKVIAAGGLPKAEQVKAAARKTRKAASEAARQTADQAEGNPTA